MLDDHLLLVFRFSASLLPVLILLIGLVVIDSYKLVRPRMVIAAIAVGVLAAVAAYAINTLILDSGVIGVGTLTRYVAPAIEEVLKGAFVVYLIRSNRAGFTIDAAIHGFAIGAGFAVAENLYYLSIAPETGFWTWIVRGFGTAVMHGGTTSILAMVGLASSERASSTRLIHFIPAFLLATALHSAFNHFILPPVASTLILVAVLPPCFAIVFHLSESATRSWLGVGFDTDQELLALIGSGEIAQTRVGEYLATLRSRFDGPVVVDMFCLLRLHVELSIRAKGVLMMQEAGFRVPLDPELQGKFVELKYLEESIGPTGMLAIKPFLHTSSRDLWQRNMLATTGGPLGAKVPRRRAKLA